MLFDKLLGLFSLDMGIDLGTANTLVCVRGEGIVLSEPSVVAVKRGTNQVLLNGNAVGLVAKEMWGKTPANIVAIRPLKDGVIADFDITEAMLGYFIRKVHNRKWGVKPRVVISIPSGITAVEKRAVTNSAERAGARKVYLIEEPMAAGIGVGLPVQEPTANMIVDIGGGTTEVAVISLAGIVTSESIRVAGDEMDDAVKHYIKRTYNLLIGDQTAERIKMQIGSAHPLEEELSMEVKGVDSIAGLPRRAVINSEEIRDALREPVELIINAVKVTLEKTPPELAGDLVDNGMILCGGGGLLRGLDKVLMEETGIPCTLAADPLTVVAKGTAEILEQIDLLAKILASSEDQI
ncbi:MAG: rod shape-determining protein [Planctomycetota bacterium]|nr:MAG: rod shape-determining protein [Planctomycetota bacterium]